MERKVPFLSISPARTGVLRLHEHSARHVEPLALGFAAVVTSHVYFGGSSTNGLANVELSVVVSHFGQTIMTVESGALQFSPANASKFYATKFSISIGGQKITAGFAGKSKSRRNCGWLPKYMYIKLEPVKPVKK